MENLTCILIDDDEDHHIFFSIAIEEQSVNVSCKFYTKAKSALAELFEKKANKPDVIFLDLNMPELGGLECLQILKENADTSDIPVIMYSTSDNSKDVLKAKQIGASTYLVKPASIKEMVLQLKTVFEDLTSAHVV